jgi:hypothetical protein
LEVSESESEFGGPESSAFRLFERRACLGIVTVTVPVTVTVTVTVTVAVTAAVTATVTLVV